MMKSLILAAAVAVVVMVWDGAAAQSGCTMALVSLSPCINYVSGNSSTPSSSCCSSLSSVVGSQPQCLCSLLKGGSSNLGIAVNQTLALALPAACKVDTPPVSRCDAVDGPTSAPSPAVSPSGAPTDDAPEDPTTPSSVPDVPSSDAGSKTVPTRTDGSPNSGSNVGATALISVAVLMASSILAFS